MHSAGLVGHILAASDQSSPISNHPKIRPQSSIFVNTKNSTSENYPYYGALFGGSRKDNADKSVSRGKNASPSRKVLDKTPCSVHLIFTGGK
jgi:hypothetical protein